MKSKLENGEVIERFEKKFGFNLWKEVQGFARGENEPAEVKVGKGWINISNDVKQFIYYALNQQRRNTIKEVINEIARDKYWLDGNFNEKEFSNRLKEFLTKLKEEK